MIPAALTTNSLLCALIYLIVAAAALPLALGWAPSGSSPANRQKWLWVALIFVGLAAWRLGLGEIRVQEQVRAFTRRDGIYEDRHPGQAVATLAAVALVMFAAWKISLGWLATNARRALGAAAALVLYSLVRLISLHAVDAVIYRPGRFHLNYVIDLGLTVICLGFCVLEYRSTAHSRGKSKSKSRR
jgi:hypothetical protein